jgi:hypothetical protein
MVAWPHERKAAKDQGPFVPAPMSQQSQSSRIDGLALFAGATFALGLGTMIALDRVGVPGALVKAMGPVLALVGLTVFGVGSRTAGLASFMAAKRRVRPFYGGLGVVAVTAGIAFCLYPELSSLSDPPALGVLAGAALGSVVYGPLVRAFGATSLSDVIATRFSGSPIRLVSTIVISTTAALTALAGYQSAVTATQALVISNRLWAEAIVALVLILSVSPGGLAGVASCAAASGGALAMIALVGFASGWSVGLSPLHLDVALLPASLAFGSPNVLAPTIATILATAGFFAFETAAVASPSSGAAFKAGLAAVFVGVVIVAAASASSLFPIGSGSDRFGPVATSLVGTATLIAALALARLGVHGVSRALGVALADPPRPFPTLASVRLARMRAVQIVVVIGCAACDSRGVLESRTALLVAMAISLAVTTPLVALAAIPRVGPASAIFGLIAAIAMTVFQSSLFKGPLNAADLFQGALVSAAVAFVAGALASLIAPRRGAAPTPGAFDPFADKSG